MVAILFFLLGNWRAALIATLVIPLSLLLERHRHEHAAISGNLMSLGALDFGLIIDGAVIIVENNLRRHAQRQASGRTHTDPRRAAGRSGEILAGNGAARRCTARSIIFLVFLPCLTFQGVEGKMFSPMVITLMLALASAFVLTLTFVPAMTALLLSGHVREDGSRPSSAKAKALLRTLAAQDHCAARRPFIGAAVGIFALALVVFVLIGREFMPTLDEQNLQSLLGAHPLHLHRPVAGAWTFPSSGKPADLPEVEGQPIPRLVPPAWRLIRCRPTPPTTASFSNPKTNGRMASPPRNR